MVFFYSTNISNKLMFSIFFLVNVILIMTFIYFSFMKTPSTDLTNNFSNLYSWLW